MQQLPYTQAQKQYTKAQEQNSSNDVTVSEHQNTLLAISHDKKSDINFNADDAQTISNNIEAVRAHINHNREAGTQIIKCTLPEDGRTAYVEIDPKSLYVVGFDIYKNGKLKVDEQPQTSVRVKDSSNQSNIKNGSKSDTRVGRTKIPQNQGQKKEEKQAKQEKIEYIDSTTIAYKNGTKAQFSSDKSHDLLDAFGTRIAESIRFPLIQRVVAENNGTIPDGDADFAVGNNTYYMREVTANAEKTQIEKNILENILSFKAVPSEQSGSFYGQLMQRSDLIKNWEKLSKQTVLCNFVLNLNQAQQDNNPLLKEMQDFQKLNVVATRHQRYVKEIGGVVEFLRTLHDDIGEGKKDNLKTVLQAIEGEIKDKKLTANALLDLEKKCGKPNN